MTIRPAVLKFAELMEARLREHDHKGGWEKDDALTLARRLKSNADTLPAGGVEAAVDTANYALMLADKAGAL